jgi:hypothetical protein
VRVGGLSGLQVAADIQMEGTERMIRCEKNLAGHPISAALLLCGL